jgi:hypothetical protein
MKKKNNKSKKSFLSSLRRISRPVISGMFAGAFVGIVAVTAQGAMRQSTALSVSSPRDCDTNAVINCGALTTTELRQRYNNHGVPAIYKYFKITEADINRVSSTAVAGKVNKNGTVTVGNKIVATNAKTAGRLNINGSTRVTSGGVTFYTRPPSVSFQQNSLAAFVVMENGKFKYAVISACGNPVSATPVTTPRPTPPPPPAVPTKPVRTPQPTPPPPPAVPPTPVPETTTPSTQTPPSTPLNTAQPVAAPEELPQTGAGELLIVTLFAVIGGYIAHLTQRSVRNSRSSRR